MISNNREGNARPFDAKRRGEPHTMTNNPIAWQPKGNPEAATLILCVEVTISVGNELMRNAGEK